MIAVCSAGVFQKPNVGNGLGRCLIAADTGFPARRARTRPDRLRRTRVAFDGPDFLQNLRDERPDENARRRKTCVVRRDAGNRTLHFVVIEDIASVVPVIVLTCRYSRDNRPQL